MMVGTPEEQIFKEMDPTELPDVSRELSKNFLKNIINTFPKLFLKNHQTENSQKFHKKLN